MLTRRVFLTSHTRSHWFNSLILDLLHLKENIKFYFTMYYLILCKLKQPFIYPRMHSRHHNKHLSLSLTNNTSFISKLNTHSASSKTSTELHLQIEIISTIILLGISCPLTILSCAS